MAFWRIWDPPSGRSLWVVERDGDLDTLDHWGAGISGEPIPVGCTVLEALRCRHPTAKVGKASLGLGEYHPRIWRRFYSPPPAGWYLQEWTLTIQAARNLIADMNDVFRCVEPSVGSNSFTHGHRIRDLLMLACMEVESAWKSVLNANDYRSPRGQRMDTKDYVELLKPLRLDEWELALTMHPGFPAFKPFLGWDASNPSSSLSWYDSYNAVKHGREANFHRATLQDLVFALGAVFVMASAQFGPWVRSDDNPWEDRDILPFASWTDDFRVIAPPSFAPEETYVPPCCGDASTTWTARKLW